MSDKRHGLQLYEWTAAEAADCAGAIGPLKERIRELMYRTRGVSVKRMAGDLSQYLRGWRGYCGKCETPSTGEGLEAWTKRRLRSAIWKAVEGGTVRFAGGKRLDRTNGG
jgi:RNA-directed DNA polymerase